MTRDDDSQISELTSPFSNNICTLFMGTLYCLPDVTQCGGAFSCKIITIMISSCFFLFVFCFIRSAGQINVKYRFIKWEWGNML